MVFLTSLICNRRAACSFHYRLNVRCHSSFVSKIALRFLFYSCSLLTSLKVVSAEVEKNALRIDEIFSFSSHKNERLSCIFYAVCGIC